VEKIQGQLKSDKVTDTLHKDLCRVMIISHSVLFRMRTFSDKTSEQIKTHNLCSVKVFPPENRDVY